METSLHAAISLEKTVLFVAASYSGELDCVEYEAVTIFSNRNISSGLQANWLLLVSVLPVFGLLEDTLEVVAILLLTVSVVASQYVWLQVLTLEVAHSLILEQSKPQRPWLVAAGLVLVFVFQLALAQTALASARQLTIDLVELD